jgi:hypothetical protein
MAVSKMCVKRCLQGVIRSSLTCQNVKEILHNIIPSTHEPSKQVRPNIEDEA